MAVLAERKKIGVIAAATLGVVMLSPAMTLYGGFGPAYLDAGKAAPLAFLWALFATLPTAVSYIVLSQKHPTSGSAADWADKAFSSRVGVWAGWMVFLYYLTNFIIQPVTLGVFAGDLFKLGGISPGFLTFGIGALVCLIWGASFVYRGISFSSHGALGFLLLETFVVTALCVTVVMSVIHGGGHFDLEGFSVAASPKGTSGVFRAMVFGMLAFCGFDVVSTLAEETREPEKNIPRATFLSLAIYALIIIAGIWSLTYSAPADDLRKIAEVAGQMPISEVARRQWGLGGILIPITGISATLGLAIATSIGASRVLFSMARSKLAPTAFSTLTNETPRNALHAIFITALVSSLITAISLGPFDSYVWWGTTSTFFAMITYVLVNGSNLVLHRKEWMSGVKPILLYFIIPLIGVLVDLYLLYRTFFLELWDQPWATGKSVVVFDMLCCLVALAVALKWRQPEATKPI